MKISKVNAHTNGAAEVVGIIVFISETITTTNWTLKTIRLQDGADFSKDSIQVEFWNKTTIVVNKLMLNDLIFVQGIVGNTI
jgi:hypothetical protein